MRALLSRLTRAKLDLSDLRVTVYTRRECCCCHRAIELLENYRRRYRFTIEAVDVDADRELAEQHGTTVPVVAIGNKVRFRGVVNPVLLERLLVAESRAR